MAGSISSTAHRALAAEVHPALDLAFRPQQRHHVAEAHDLADLVEAPAPRDLAADLRLAEPWLAAAEQLAHPERGGVPADQVPAAVGQVASRWSPRCWPSASSPPTCSGRSRAGAPAGARDLPAAQAVADRVRRARHGAAGRAPRRSRGPPGHGPRPGAAAARPSWSCGSRETCSGIFPATSTATITTSSGYCAPRPALALLVTLAGGFAGAATGSEIRALGVGAAIMVTWIVAVLARRVGGH